MSATAASLSRKIASTGYLQRGMRKMKAMTTANVGQHEKAVRVPIDYDRTVEVGLGICVTQIM